MLISKFLHKTPLLKTKQYLSTVSQQLQDWQYTSQIHTNLRNGNINSALSSLINSYLNGKVLDIQTYNTMHLKVKEQQLDISYHEVLYRLYRETFKPHFLMVEWMKVILQSESQQLREKVKADFEVLKINVPDISTSATQEVNAEPYPEPEPEPQKSKQQEKQKQKHPRINHHIEPDQIKLILQSLLNKYSKVIIHDVEISCQNFMEEQQNLEEDKHEYEEEYQDEQGEEEDGDNDGVQDQFVTSISKIKIGRIQILDPKPNDDKDGEII